MAYLLTVSGAGLPERYELSGDTATVGRQPDCEISLKDAGRVSRYHARIVRDGQNFLVQDLGSHDGTFLNDVRIDDQRHTLKSGDRLSVCNVSFVFYDETPTEDGTTVDQQQLPSADSDVSAIPVDDDESSASKSAIKSKADVGSQSDDTTSLSANLQTRLSALTEITRVLGSELPLEDVFPQVLNSLFRIFLQADRGVIVLRTPDGELVPRWTKSRSPNGEETIRISRTIVRHVIDSKEAILSADAGRDEYLEMSQSIADLRIRSVMCAPLLDSDGNPLGYIQIDTLDQRKRFQQDDLEVLASVGVQAGIAIDNARLRETTAPRKEIEYDLALAYQVQKGFLPPLPPEIKGYTFCNVYIPNNQIGAGFYDYISLPDGRTAVVLADVVGHGITAGMLMAKLSFEVKYGLISESDPAQALCKLNDRHSHMQLDRFATLILVVLDPVHHEVTIVNAGHMAPIWRLADGTLLEPGSTSAGLPVGIMEGFAYESKTITLGPGELLLMYTDGVIEATNPIGEQYSLDRLKCVIQRTGRDVKRISQAIVEDVRLFMEGVVQTDDLCIVGVGRNREPEAAIECAANRG